MFIGVANRLRFENQATAKNLFDPMKENIVHAFTQTPSFNAQTTYIKRINPNVNEAHYSMMMANGETESKIILNEQHAQFVNRQANIVVIYY